MKKLILVLALLLSACLPVSPLLATPTAVLRVPAQYGTIQAAINAVKAGQEILVASGTYNEDLTLKTNGPITLQCEGSCTVNSGSARTLMTSGNVGYWVIDGFRFVSTFSGSSDPMTATVNFSYNYWGDGDTKERGNDGFVLRNCYVEGAVYFYGSDNLVENCELNGRGTYYNGLTERSQPSENNIFRNNVIHDYRERGGWSLQMTHDTLWRENTIYNIGSNSGIDCDGAGSAVYGCNLIGNVIHNVTGGVGGFLLENSFNSLVEGNTVYSSSGGIAAINYNKINSDGFRSDADYQGLVTNTIIKNNVFYNLSGAGLDCHAVRGNQFVNNTIYKGAGYGALSFQTYNGYACPVWIVKNNIVAQSPKTMFLVGNPEIDISNNFYDVFTATVYNSGNKTFAQWQALGHDVNSKVGNVLFVDPAIGDFRLQPDSPACGYGALPCIDGSATPTQTPTSTATQTLTFTPTNTPTRMPTATPTTIPTEMPQVSICVYVTWNRGLNLRPGATMHNYSIISDDGKFAVNISKGTLLRVEEVIENIEGRWAKFNPWAYFAMWLKSNNQTYAVPVECPSDVGKVKIQGVASGR